MKTFVTGASGFIGSEVVKNLIENGHQVLGLARSEASAEKIKTLGAEVLIGELEDLDIIKKGVQETDGVIHTAFIHDFNQYVKANEVDANVIKAMGEALKGTNKPLVVTSGILGLPLIDGMITEESVALNSPRSSEAVTLQLAEEGINASVVRLPPAVHDEQLKGFVPTMIEFARKHGHAAYPNNGENRWTAAHRKDAAQAFVQALTVAKPGALYNAIAEGSVTVKSIAEVISKNLNLPIQSISGDAIPQYFEWMSMFIGLDSPGTSTKTQTELNWKPSHIGLLEEMELHYF